MKKSSKLYCIALLLKAIFVPVDPYNTGVTNRLRFTGLVDSTGSKLNWFGIMQGIREWE